MKIEFLACLVCLPFMNCAISNTCKIDVLSETVRGMFFHFDGKQVRGFGKDEVFIFKATNSRTGKSGVVKILGKKNGGSKGDSHGIFKNARPGDWKVGDMVMIKDKVLCNQAISNTCKIDVLSVQGYLNSRGMYFHFDGKQVRGFGEGETFKFKATNPRTGKSGQVKIVGNKFGGNKGDSFGRFELGKDKEGDWKAGDVVMIKDKVLCNSA